MTDVLDIALVGVGGFGTTFVPTLLKAAERNCRFVAGVDPLPEKSAKIADLRAANVPVYATTAELYEKHKPHLVILSTPIPLHARQAEEALAQGANVLCEKPIAATPADAAAMKAARDRAGRHVAIGYQWSFTDCVQKLKADALAGVFGRLKRMRTMVLWPRDAAYYARNDWAGKIKNARGDWVLDSPANNASAHHLHNMLYVAGDAVDRSATPLRVTAELYRANPIQNFDTAALRVKVAGGAELLYLVTHAGQKTQHPKYVFEYEHATVAAADDWDSQTFATFADGTRRDYGSPNVDVFGGKLWQTVNAIRAGRPSLCGIEAATPHCQVIWACQRMSDRIKTFAASDLSVAGTRPNTVTSLPGMDETLTACWDAGKLPSEMNVPWATNATTVAIE